MIFHDTTPFVHSVWSVVAFVHFLLSNMHTHSGVWMTDSTYIYMHYNGGYSCHTMRTEYLQCDGKTCYKLIHFVSRLSAIPSLLSISQCTTIISKKVWKSQKLRAKMAEETNVKELSVRQAKKNRSFVFIECELNNGNFQFSVCITFSSKFHARENEFLWALLLLQNRSYRNWNAIFFSSAFLWFYYYFHWKFSFHWEKHIAWTWSIQELVLALIQYELHILLYDNVHGYECVFVREEQVLKSCNKRVRFCCHAAPSPSQTATAAAAEKSKSHSTFQSTA